MNTRIHEIFPPEQKPEFTLRADKIKAHLSRIGADAVLLSDNADVYYMSGRFFRGYVYVAADRDPLYFVIRPVGLKGDNVVAIRKPEQIADELGRLGYPLPKRLGLQLDSLTWTEAERLRKAFPESECVNGSDAPRQARITKTDAELQLMRADGLHQTECYRRIPGLWRPDMTDIELQAGIEHIMRLEGALGYTRTAGALMEINMGSLLHGDNADAPSPYDFSMGGAGTDLTLPVGADGSVIRRGEAVMVDMTGAFNGYQTDITRVWRVGEISDLAVKAHECSRTILRTLEKEAIPGAKVSDLYHRAAAIVEEQGLSDYFMGHAQKAAFIGHGVGIQLNEPPVLTPRSREILQKGMTIAIEPKFVIPGTGAVGVENTYVVTDTGLECLTPFPEEIAEL